MRILFVDDEAQVLEGIERTLFHVEDWEIECATSGAEALEILSEEQFDVVVSDMRMPGMDGAQLLTRVHAEHPTTIRLVLSGHAEQELAMRTVGVAHQFIAKPCAPGALQAAIEHTVQLQRLLSTPTVQNLVGKVPTLPSAPAIYTELARLMSEKDVDLAQITAVVETDPALCAKLLQVVNSAFFAQSQPTTEVHAAIVKLGVLTLKGLVVSLEALGKFEKAEEVQGFSLQSERTRAHQVALLASALTESKKLRADAFMAGILHDIGKWVLASEAPEILSRVIALSKERGTPIHSVELEEYGATHAEVGAYLLGLWSLPESVVCAVANHHAPERVVVREGAFDIAHVVHIAGEFVDGRPLSNERLQELGCKLEDGDILQKMSELGGAVHA